MSNLAKSTAALKKAFFAGEINQETFLAGLDIAYRYRGYILRPNGRPKWTGPFRHTREEVNEDNAPYRNQSINVYTYVEQW
ncbi:hypothetical protein [Pedobacter aquatilis]|uniref:hypothetical protein n=1 Tax=Pedobacter aquatilis TaxID=351343 RepID=UPI00292D2F23|nr:hypothetical protein [Pedobacter aquatilis]